MGFQGCPGELISPFVERVAVVGLHFHCLKGGTLLSELPHFSYEVLVGLGFPVLGEKAAN